MFRPETITGDQVLETFKSAASRRAAIIVALPFQNRWLAFHGSLRMDDGQLLVRFPASPQMDIAQTLGGQVCSFVFKFRGYRYIGEISTLDTVSGDEGEVVLKAKTPSSMSRYERRVHERTEISEKWKVRAEIWISDEPHSPRWGGQVLNISKGGIQIRTALTLTDFMESGDIVVLDIRFTQTNKHIQIKAYFRDSTNDGDMILAGFEFVEAQSPQDFAEILQLVEKHRLAMGA